MEILDIYRDTDSGFWLVWFSDYDGRARISHDDASYN